MDVGNRIRVGWKQLESVVQVAGAVGTSACHMRKKGRKSARSAMQGLGLGLGHLFLRNWLGVTGTTQQTL